MEEEKTQRGGVWSGIVSVAERVATKNIIAPMQWMMAIVAAFSLPGMLWAKPPLDAWCLGLFVCAAAIGFGSFIYWQFKDPDRLQSEDFRTESKRMDMQVLGDDRLSEKELPGIINAEAVPNQAQPIPMSLPTMGTSIEDKE